MARGLAIVIFAVLAAAAGAIASGAPRASASGDAPTAPIPTTSQLATLRLQIGAYRAASLIDNAGVTKSLQAKLASAAAALVRAKTDPARNAFEAFIGEVQAQRGKHVAVSAASALLATATNGPPPPIVLTAGTAATVAAVVGNSPVVLAIPEGTTITRIVVSAPSSPVALTPPPRSQAVVAIVIEAFDGNGDLVTQLGASATVGISFLPPDGTDARRATILTQDPVTGGTEQLTTQVRADADGSFTASAATTHLSPFVLYVPSLPPIGVPAVIQTVAVGSGPSGVAINAATNQVYVQNMGENTVFVIDASTLAVVATVSIGPNGRLDFTELSGNGVTGIAVNTSTNRIYTTTPLNCSGCPRFVSDIVAVIDGSTNAHTDNILMPGSGIAGIGVNSVTNRLYVNDGCGDLFVVDGNTNGIVATVPVSGGPSGVGVNDVTNRIYVVSLDGTLITVIDGGTNTVVFSTGSSAFSCRSGALFAPGVGVNPTTNKIYVPNSVTPLATPFPTQTSAPPAPSPPSAVAGNTITVFDGATNAITSVTVGNGPSEVAGNAVTNRVYVANSADNTVTVLDGVTNSVVATVAVGTFPSGIAAWVNPSDNRTYVFVTNFGDNTVSVIRD